jgi:F-type H+-transporting ATPase subunit b
MHIDWFVFFAQIVNFLILAYLLKRFLFGRIVAAMDGREARIAATLADADRMKQEARQGVEDSREQTRMWSERYEEMVRQAAEEVEAQRKELTNKARADVDDLRRRWEETVEREREAFLQHLRSETGKHICHAARKALHDLADVELERRIVDVFVRRLGELGEQEQAGLRESLAGGKGKIVVQSAFGLTPELRAQIESALRLHGANGDAIIYETLPAVVSGIELRTPGFKLAWSVDEYLESLEESLSSALQEETRH